MTKRFRSMAVAAVAMVLAGAPAMARAQSCFYPNQWTSWKAPNDHTLYLKVGRRVFRLDLASSCPALVEGDATLVTRTDATQLCSAADWNLRVRGAGGETGCIVSRMSQLTPDQIAALPPGARP